MGYTLAKPFSDVARADFICLHQGLNYYEDDNCIIMYANTEKIVNGVAVDRSQDADYIAEQLAEAKIAKLQENINKRDTRLVAGVTYKNVLFDSDQDQKINLSAIASNMSDTDIITWFGKDGVSSLNCTKTDIEAIGKLIIALTQDVWSNLNPTYINKINACKTIEELNEIEIDYAIV